MYILPVIYFIFQCYLDVNSLKFEGSTCKSSGTFGTCKRVKNCPIAVESMARIASHDLQRCGFVGVDELVCCPSTYKYSLDLEDHTVQTTVQNIVGNSPVETNIPINRQTYLTGSDIQIPCEVKGFPKPQILWYKDGVAVNPSERIKVSDFNTLIILNATNADSGHYQCEATNYHSSASSKIDILIEGMSCTDNGFNCMNILIMGRMLCAHTPYNQCCELCTESSMPIARPQSPYFYKSYS